MTSTNERKTEIGMHQIKNDN